MAGVEQPAPEADERETLRAEVDRLRALVERNGIRYCLCSRADRMHNRVIPVCPHHGPPMTGLRAAALATRSQPAPRTVTAEEALRSAADAWTHPEGGYYYRMPDDLRGPLSPGAVWQWLNARAEGITVDAAGPAPDPAVRHHPRVEELDPGHGTVLLCAIDDQAWPCDHEQDLMREEPSHG